MQKEEKIVMGHRQTAEHRPGKKSYHQIGLVRGQFGNIPMGEWLKWLKEAGFDGYEAASWELELERCGDDAGAEALAAEIVQAAHANDLEVFSVAAHLQGQGLGDEPNAKTLNLLGGECVEAYGRWRAAGNNPPRENPFYVPADVGKMAHKQAQIALVNAVRLAHFLGKRQNRIVPVSGFIGSPADCWASWFGFPPVPKKLAGYPIANVFEVSLELIVERFGPVYQACLGYGTTYDNECHPSERAMGDIASAQDYLAAVDAAGFAKAVGFNFDDSHMEWQGVSGVAFIREHGERIHCVHRKGVQVIQGHTRNGLLGGHKPMGHRHNGWNFVTSGSRRDVINNEAVLVELNRIGYSGAISIEWEDNDVNQLAGAKAALAALQLADLPPSEMAHDEQLKAKK